MEETNMNKKKLLALLMALVMTLTLVPVTALAEVVDSTSDDAVAEVGGTYYSDLQEAIAVAMKSTEESNKTVNLLKNVTVDTWYQNVFATSHTTDGTNTNYVEREHNVFGAMIGPNGITIDGKNYTLTVNEILSNGNGNLLFASAENLTVRNLTIAAPNGINIKSGIIENVIFNMTNGCAIQTSVNDDSSSIEIKGCTFYTTTADPLAYYGILSDGSNTDTKTGIIISENTFNTPRSVVLRNDMQFLRNVVNSVDGVTIDSNFTGLVEGNYFKGNTSRSMKIYSAPYAVIRENVILGPIALDNKEFSKPQDLSGNYWGGGAPTTVEGKTFSNSYYDTADIYEERHADGTLFALSNSNASVAQIGGVKYATLDAALTAAKDGDTVKLLANVSVDATVEITKSIKLDGDNHTLTTAATRGIWIDSPNVAVTIENMEIVSSNNKMERSIQVNPDCNSVTLNLNNITTTATYYTVNVCSNVDNLKLNINGCNLTGWGVINLWGNSGIVNITNSTLVGVNDKGYDADGWNDFGVIVMEGDTTGQTQEHSSAYTVEISDSTIVASSTKGNTQYVLLHNKPSVNNNLTLTGCEITMGENCQFYEGDPAISTTKIKDTYMSGTESTLPTLPEGYKYKDIEEEYKLITRRYVAQVGNTQYTTLEAAVAAAQTGDTINIIADFAIPETNTAESDRIIVNKSVTIDFGEYTMSVPGALGDDTSNNWVGLYIQGNDVNVTLTGTTGGIDCLNYNDGAGAYSFYAKDGATVTVNGGHYHGGGTVGQVAAGTLIINDGYFKVTDYSGDYSGYRYVLNCIDSYYNSGTAKITVKGGTFESFDPSDCLAEGANTNFVADGYEAVALTDEDDGWYQVGKVKASGLTPQAGATETSATYKATKKVVDSTDPETVLATGTTFTVTVDAPTDNLAEGKEAVQLSNIDVDEVVSVAVDKASEEDRTSASVIVQLAKDESAQVVAVTETTKKVTFEVHPEAIITVEKTGEDSVVPTLPLTNDQIKGAFSFKLTIPTDLATEGKKVTVIHRHSDNKEENLGAFTVSSDQTITLTGISSFSEFIATSVSEDDVTVGAVGASLRRRVLSSDHNTVVNTSTDYRVTFDWTDTGHKVDINESYMEWSNNNGTTWHKVSIANTANMGNSVTRASVVITGIPSTAFSTTIKTRIHLATSGNAIEAYGPDYSVNVVADKLSKLTGNETWSEYGKFLLGTRTEPLYVGNN